MCFIEKPLWIIPRWTGTRKVKPIWILLKQETVSGSGISWGTCKFAPRSRQITVPALHHSVFYRSDALPAAQPTASKQWKATTIGTGFFISWMPIPNVCVCMMFVLVVPLRKRWVSMLQTRLRCISITCQFHGRTFWEVSHAVDWLMIRVLCRNAYLHTVSDIFHTELSSRGTVELCCVSKYLGCAN